VARIEELTCQELVGLVTMYLETTLSPEEMSRFEAHLATCQGCANYLGQMRRTIQLVGTLRADSIPPEATARLLEAFRDWKRGA
jgi:anti-sigma factor RsiW